MGRNYSKDEIIRSLEDASDNMALLYTINCINYTGKSKEPREYYSEIIAEWLLEHTELFNEIKTITRVSSYNIDSHTGENINEDSNRIEEKIAMKLYTQKYAGPLGEFIAYQVPLKNQMEDKAGKIDILSYDEYTKTVHVLELKKADSKETMLRCALESYTYMKTVDKQKLLRDYGLSQDAKIEANPLVFKHGEQWQEVNAGRPHLTTLMEDLGIKAYYLVEEDGKYCVTD